jgi:hypothetical protein
MVYIFKTDSTPSYIKIGYSKHSPLNRLKSLQTGCPFVISLLCLKNGTEVVERLLHGHLKEFKIRSEWFIYSDDSMERINSVFKTFNISDAKIDPTPRVKKLGRRIDPALHGKIIKLKGKGLTVVKIAKELGINKCTVIRHTTNYKLRVRPTKLRQ